MTGSNHLTVAVIIPTYNRADLLPATLDSLLAQTRRPDEIIVVDDGSTDDTASVLSRYSDHVDVISQTNQGRSTARNNGVSHTSSDLIVFLDSDDLLTADSIAKRAAFLETHDDLDVVYSNVTVIDVNGTERGLFGHRHYPSGDVFTQLACNNFFPPHAYMFRRLCLEKTGYFDPTQELLEDYDFWVRMAAYHRFAYLNEALAYYRLHDNMTVQQQASRLHKQSVMMQGRVFYMPRFQTLRARQKAMIYCSHGTKNARAGDRQTASYYYRKAIATAPLYHRGYILLLLHMLLGQRRFGSGIHKKNLTIDKDN